MLTQGPIGKPHPEPGVLFALFQRVRSKHLFLGGGRDTARVGQPDSDTQESLFSEDREMDEREAMAPGRSRVGFCFLVCCGLSADGGGRGKEGGEEEPFKGLEPEFLLSGTICFSKAY